jgi:formylglycine-generating enzyme required for sulfatase activity
VRALLLALSLFSACALAAGNYQHIPAGEYRPVLKYEDLRGNRRVAAFELMKWPVTNAEFLAFVTGHPEWRRDRVPALYAEPGGYLSHWQSPLQLGSSALPRQPVTQVSWFAAEAFCESQGARLPEWSEWEYVAAADETRRDARADPAWSERILAWYARNSAGPLHVVGQSPANAYGIQDLHGLIWEWTGDYAAMLVSGDNRSQTDADRRKFCGAGALAVSDRENYPVMMRIALLSSLRGANTTRNLGFRCARSLP